MVNLVRNNQSLIVIIPAAGVGKRMQAHCPKQYLKINQHTILEHTVLRLLSHPLINQVIISLGAEDEYIFDTTLAGHESVQLVVGGQERVDSVLSGLKAVNIKNHPWVLVHDAARPCLSLVDLDKLISRCLTENTGGILACRVKDTMKRGEGFIEKTVERESLWHALTPQMYPTEQLISAIELAQKQNVVLTDEASAIEFIGENSLLVEGSSENIKITQPDDLAYAEFILNKQHSKES